MKVHEVELDEVVAEDLGRLVAFDNILWTEEEPGEPLLADQVVAWIAYSNAPMLAINDKLGYRVTATQTAWQARTAEVLYRVGGSDSALG